MTDNSDATKNALDEFLKALAPRGPVRQPTKTAGPPLVEIDATLLNIFVLDSLGRPTRPCLVLAWRVGALAPCGAHLGLAATGWDAYRACVTDELGVARRAMELDRAAIDGLLLHGGQPVTFVLNHGVDMRELATWALSQHHDVLFRTPSPYLKGTLERVFETVQRAVAQSVSAPGLQVDRVTVGVLRELLALVLAARAKVGRRS